MRTLLVILSVAAVTQGASWNKLLKTKIFPAERDAIVAQATDKASVIQELEALLADGALRREIYSNYKQTYGKSSPRSNDLDHEGVFVEKLIQIAEKNLNFAAGSASWEKAVNEFMDRTQAEIRATHAEYKVIGGADLTNSSIPKTQPRQIRPTASDEALDWRDYGVISSPKGQGGCATGGIYFAATAILESSHALFHNGTMLDLSEQQLIDCSREHGNVGCVSATLPSTFDYLMDGQNPEGEYPYEGRDTVECRSAGRSRPARVIGWWTVEPRGDENVLKEAVSLFGPIAATIHANEDFEAYGGGIFDVYCQGEPNHAVLIVGYGSENGTEFWLAKNSRSEYWGEGGYIRIRRNFGNVCDIAGEAYLINA